jgi:hypothetical protein
MHRFLSSYVKILLIGLFLFLLNACGGKPFNYHPQTEIPKEAGVFGKEDNGLVLYDSKKKKAEKTSSGSQRNCKIMKSSKNIRSGRSGKNPKKILMSTKSSLNGENGSLIKNGRKRTTHQNKHNIEN